MGMWRMGGDVARGWEHVGGNVAQGWGCGTGVGMWDPKFNQALGYDFSITQAHYRTVVAVAS